MNDLSIWPPPRTLRLTGGAWAVPDDATVAVPPDCARAARAVFQALEDSGAQVSKDWKPSARPAVELILDPAAAEEPEGHRIVIGENGVRMASPSVRGLLCAAASLRQMARTLGRRWPCLEIADAPAFAVRGYMLDISRDKVPTMAALLGIVDLLAELKFNRFELYTEHTFAYAAHPEVWAEASPMTPDEIRELDRACADRGIDLVPNQNSLAHMERWLRHPRYAPLAEAPDGWIPHWGGLRRPPSCLDPGNPATLDLLRSLYDELLPCFSVRSINAGCDEPFEIGIGRSRARCEAEGKGRVLLDHILALHRDLARRGVALQIWADALQHHPGILAGLPRDVTALEWGYEADHDFDRRCARLADAGVPFLVCPGTSTWNSVAGRWTNALGNLDAAARTGRARGAGGYLVTDWGDGGHLHPWPASWLPLAAGAACAWGGAAPPEASILRAADLHLYRDPSGEASALARELADAYRSVGREIFNASPIFRWLLPDVPDSLHSELDPARIRAAGERAGAAAARWSRARMDRPDAEWVREEWALAARLLDLGCARGAALNEGRDDALILADLADKFRAAEADHRRLWLLRNRPGGLNDSATRLSADRGQAI